MHKGEILSHLKVWQKTVEDVDSSYHTLSDVVGANAEAPMFKAIFSTLESYTELMDAWLVNNESSGWLSWYMWENQLGHNALEAGEDPKPIETLSDLADLMLVEREQIDMVVLSVSGGAIDGVYASKPPENMFVSILDFDNSPNIKEDRKNLSRSVENLYKVT